MGRVRGARKSAHTEPKVVTVAERDVNASQSLLVGKSLAIMRGAKAAMERACEPIGNAPEPYAAEGRRGSWSLGSLENCSGRRQTHDGVAIIKQGRDRGQCPGIAARPDDQTGLRPLCRLRRGKEWAGQRHDA